jgi:hypothetical protein
MALLKGSVELRGKPSFPGATGWRFWDPPGGVPAWVLNFPRRMVGARSAGSKGWAILATGLVESTPRPGADRARKPLRQPRPSPYARPSRMLEASCTRRPAGRATTTGSWPRSSAQATSSASRRTARPASASAVRQRRRRRPEYRETPTRVWLGRSRSYGRRRPWSARPPAAPSSHR